MSKSTNGIGSKKRRQILRILFKQLDGKCALCKCEVLIASDALASGKWVWYLPSRYLQYHNTMERVSVATLDHVIPRSKGGSNHITNLTMLCHHCNYVKGNSV